MIGGHESAGVVEKVGPGVRSVKPGDHVAVSFVPSCGRCSWCARGKQNLCDLGAGTLIGLQLDGTSRHHVDGADARLMCMVGAFANHTVVSEASVVKIDTDVPFEIAALVSCGVTTGWGSAVYTGGVKPGDTVVVMGVGGVGVNAVQGATHAGAETVVAVDPVEFRRDKALAFGATHAVASHEEAFALVNQITWGRHAEVAIVSVGVTTPDTVRDAMSLVGKTGTVVLTSMAPFTQDKISLSLIDVTAYEKSLKGSLFGSANPRHDIPNLLRLWQAGHLKLDELATRRYKLDDVNAGYEDMYSGSTVRGVLSLD
jgi:S-(hydroxymethyl)glutathione dehydrogenase/alcohol dehydrogenase